MDLNTGMLVIIEIFKKAYSIIFSKPYATIKVRYLPKKDSAGKINEEFIECSIINESFGDIKVHSVWFLTAYNRQVYSTYMNSQMPITISEDNSVTFLIPIEELRSSLNKNVIETITRAIVYDSNGYKYTGFVDRVAQEQIAR